ncbi:MAG TPA: hypothetical protein VFN24_06430 [Microbacterium sp.]|nr:hypothetical protein [Microbacterium sp.]
MLRVAPSARARRQRPLGHEVADDCGRLPAPGDRLDGADAVVQAERHRGSGSGEGLAVRELPVDAAVDGWGQRPVQRPRGNRRATRNADVRDILSRPRTDRTLGSHGSRHYLYSSLDDLVGDAKVVVVGTVESSSPAQVDGAAFTEFNIAVEEELFPPSLGQKPIDEHTPAYTKESLGADAIIVRQVGAPGTGPAPDLKIGEEYLLFLSPTGLPDDPDTTFYITGGTAGMFTSENGAFTRLSDEDELPRTLSLSDLR